MRERCPVVRDRDGIIANTYRVGSKRARVSQASHLTQPSQAFAGNIAKYACYRRWYELTVIHQPQR
jgi:hypothetical protein